ncbi:MAG: lysylphosphatidylglycerol synthase transmembrane domain-containing protein [Geminicoccaceae bacterium]
MRTVLARRLTSTMLALLVSAVVLWWLLADGAGEALVQALATAHLWPLVLGSMIAIVIQMIRAWRFAILNAGSMDLPSWTMIGIASKLVLLNFLLPFKLGELGFPLMMKRAFGTPFSRGAGILILCRLLDFGVVAAIILVTAAWLLDPAIHGWNPWLVSLVGLAVLAGPLLLADLLPWLRRLLVRWPRIAGLAEQLSHGAAIMHPPGRRLSIFALTLSIWFAHAVIAWLAAIAVMADPGFPSMAMASAASNLAFALPISGVAGLGPPQAAWATMLHLAGHDWPLSVTTALLCHGVLLTTLSLFGAAFWASQSLRNKPTIDAATSDQRSATSSGGR